MDALPKCTSWRGHKFEARYSKGAANTPDFEGPAIAFIEIAERSRSIAYERDICVRCGFVVERTKGGNHT